MQSSKLTIIFLKNRTEENRNNYAKQRNLCVTLLRKSKRELYGNLNEKTLCCNKKFWRVVKSVLSNKVFLVKKSLLLNRATLQKLTKKLQQLSTIFSQTS